MFLSQFVLCPHCLRAPTEVGSDWCCGGEVDDGRGHEDDGSEHLERVLVVALLNVVETGVICGAELSGLLL